MKTIIWSIAVNHGRDRLPRKLKGSALINSGREHIHRFDAVSGDGDLSAGQMWAIILAGPLGGSKDDTLILY